MRASTVQQCRTLIQTGTPSATRLGARCGPPQKVNTTHDAEGSGACAHRNCNRRFATNAALQGKRNHHAITRLHHRHLPQLGRDGQQQLLKKSASVHVQSRAPSPASATASGSGDCKTAAAARRGTAFIYREGARQAGERVIAARRCCAGMQPRRLCCGRWPI